MIRGNQRVKEREDNLYFGYLLVHCHGHHSRRPSALSHLTQLTPDYPLRKVPMLTGHSDCIGSTPILLSFILGKPSIYSGDIYT
jgi:hypothetical protein